MDQLTDTLEAIQEELGDDDFDVEYSVSIKIHFTTSLSEAHEADILRSLTVDSLECSL